MQWLVFESLFKRSFFVLSLNQLKKPNLFTMEQSNTPSVSTKGKGLGMAGMIIGIVALVWSCIPLVGAAAWWLAVVGLILSVIAFFMAKGGGNPKRGAMLAGIIINIVALALAIYWITQIMSAVGTGFDDLKHAMDSMKIDTITMH